MSLAFQLLLVIAAVLLSGLFSGSETGVYRLSRFHLRLGIKQRRPFFALLADILSDSRGYVLTVLIGNNLSNYLATSLVTYIIIQQIGLDHAAEFYATVILTPLLFLCGEVIPKSIYYLHSDAILPRTAPLLWFFHQLFSRLGAVAFFKRMADMLSRFLRLPPDAADVITAGQRTQIKQIINETRDEGIVSSFQKDIMDRTVDIPAMPVQAVMTPAARVVMVDVQTDAVALRAILKNSPYTRLPVYEDSRDRLVGFINIYQVLAEEFQFSDLRGFLRPIGRLTPAASVLDAMIMMRRKNYRMMSVTSAAKGDEKVVGIITMTDLIEELTGELAQW